MGWSDLRSNLVISIATRLSEPDDYVRFRAVCKSWKSALRGFRPSFFPWLAVIPDPDLRCESDELWFISHATNDRIYKRRPLPYGHISLDEAKVSNKNGWIMFVLDDYLPIIFNPFTGARLQRLPSLRTFLDRQTPGKIYDFDLFLSDNLVAFAECYDCNLGGYHVLATASQGDEEWSFIRLSSTHFEGRICGIVFHQADRKFYAMDCKGEMRSFRLVRRWARKTVFREVTTLAKSTDGKYRSLLFHHLVSDGTNLLQVRKTMDSMEFDVLKYLPDADMWVKMINLDLGNNSLFVDFDRAILLPLPQGDGYLEKKEGRPRRNCIYYMHFDENPPPPHEEQDYARVYDVGKGTVDPCISTIIPSNYFAMPLMWFTPSLSVEN